MVQRAPVPHEGIELNDSGITNLKLKLITTKQSFMGTQSAFFKIIENSSQPAVGWEITHISKDGALWC